MPGIPTKGMVEHISISRQVFIVCIVDDGAKNTVSIFMEWSVPVFLRTGDMQVRGVDVLRSMPQCHDSVVWGARTKR